MAKIFDLEANARVAEGTADVKRLRKAGRIPAVIYGKKQETSNVEVDAKTFRTILQGTASDHILVNLKIAGTEALALVQEVQHDYLRGGVLHVDFHAINANENIRASVPLIVLNADLAEKKGGQLDHILHNVEVNCLPKDLPETIQVDVSGLSVGEVLHLGQIELPEGVSTVLGGNVVVANLREARVVEAPVEAAPAKKGKK